ncbi:TonB-dependent receptor plug domain-containing protein [Bdellovibrionota bacterium FG-1]
MKALVRLRALFPLLWLIFVSLAQASSTVHLEGSLRERGTRKPLEGVHVFCIPQTAEGQNGKVIKATTDTKGRFSLNEVPTGPLKWVIQFTGYERFEYYDEQSSDAPLPIPPREFYLEKSSYLTYETTIYDKAQKRDDKTRSITRDQISKLAGAGNDPIKAVQNLPGVNRTSNFSSQVIIEGSSPQDTGYQLEGHEVPIIFHFGGLSTIVPPEAVDRVDLLTSGFGAEYGRTTAGLVGVWLKSPATDRIHGLGFVDIFNLGGILEGPIDDKSSFLISARQSYIGLVLKTLFKNNKDFNLTVAPDFSDLTAIYQREVTPIDSFKLVTVGSLDTLSFVLAEPVKSNPALRGNFSTLTSFFRVIPEWTHRHSARTISRLSLGLGKDWVRFDTQDNFFHLNAFELTVRGELEKQINDYWRTFIGFDNAYSWATVDFALPKIYSAGGVSNPIGAATTVNASVKQSNDQIGLYWRNELRMGETPLTLIPALRADYFQDTHEWIPEPRLQIRYKLSETLSLRSSGGLYSQPPQPQETSSSYGNPNLKAPLAAHATLGVEKDFREGSSKGWTLSSDVFYKHFYRLILPSFATVTAPDGTTQPENYNNNGSGRAFGLEGQARYDFKPWSGWISYTVSRSSRWSPDQPEAIYRYDQTHNLAAVGSVELPHNWQISARFRYVTGNPLTPITGGTLDVDNDIYIPARGAFYSERLDPFWQVDLRVDKKWIYNTWILSAYFDLQNVSGIWHRNSQAILYSYDYSQKTIIQDIPLLPIFGLKGEF